MRMLFILPPPAFHLRRCSGQAAASSTGAGIRWRKASVNFEEGSSPRGLNPVFRNVGVRRKNMLETAPATEKRRGTKAPADAGRFFRQDILRAGTANYIPPNRSNVSSATFRVITLITFSPRMPPHTELFRLTAPGILSGGRSARGKNAVELEFRCFQGDKSDRRRM